MAMAGGLWAVIPEGRRLLLTPSENRPTVHRVACIPTPAVLTPGRVLPVSGTRTLLEVCFTQLFLWPCGTRVATLAAVLPQQLVVLGSYGQSILPQCFRIKNLGGLQFNKRCTSLCKTSIILYTYTFALDGFDFKL